MKNNWGLKNELQEHFFNPSVAPWSNNIIEREGTIIKYQEETYVQGKLPLLKCKTCLCRSIEEQLEGIRTTRESQ